MSTGRSPMPPTHPRGVLRLLAAAVGMFAVASCGDRVPADQARPPALDPEPVQMITDPLRIQALNVGKQSKADLSVDATTLFAPGDPIIAAVSTVGTSDAATLRVRLVYRDGMTYGDLKQTVKTVGPRITSFRFPRDTPWPIGRYTVVASVDDREQIRQPIEVLDQQRSP